MRFLFINSDRKYLLTAHKKITRKKFFRYSFYLLTFPLIYLWAKLIEERESLIDTKKLIKIPLDLPNGASVYDDVLIYKQYDLLKIFSARCTHLGCKINKIDSGNFVCPCHGSKYLFNGEVSEGPAYKSLKQLDYKIDQKEKVILVEINGKV